MRGGAAVEAVRAESAEFLCAAGVGRNSKWVLATVIERPLLKRESDLLKIVDASDRLCGGPAVREVSEQALAEGRTGQQADGAEGEAEYFKRECHGAAAGAYKFALPLKVLLLSRCGCNAFVERGVVRICGAPNKGGGTA